MKKILTLSVFIFAFLFSGIAHAQISSANANRINNIKQKITDVKQQAKDKRVEIKEIVASSTAVIKNLKQDIKNTRQEIKSAVEMRIGKKLDAQKNKVADVFENAIQNEKDLITRIESRMTKMVSENISTASSTVLLETAKAKLTLAETELTNLETLLSQDIPASTSTNNSVRKTVLQNIKVQSEKTKIAIKAAHASIIEVVASLKFGQMKKISTSTKPAISTTSGKLIGGDKDVHGCLGSAGYSWCAVKNKCLRVWEEKCVDPTNNL